MADQKSSKKHKPLNTGSLKMPGFNESLGEDSKISFTEDRFRKAAESLLPDWERRLNS